MEKHMEKQNEKPPASAEELADLAYLQTVANDDAAAMAPGDQVPETSAADEWAMLPAMVGGMLKIAMPELEKVYTPESCRAWGEAMVPVAEKYGWDVSGVMSCELVAIAATVPLLLGTVQAVQALKERNELLRMKKRADAQAHYEISRGLPDGALNEPAPAAPSKTVQFGTAQ